MTGYLTLADGSTYGLDLLDPGLLAAWRRQKRLSRAVESDTWTATGGGADDRVDVTLAVRVDTGSAIGDATAIDALLDAAEQARFAGIYLDGARKLERTIYGLLRTASSPLGRGWRVTLTLAGGPEVWAVGYLVNDDGDRLVDDAGNPIVYAGRF